MLNIFKTKMPLLDPKEFESLQIGFQHTLWNEHPYHLTINLKNKNKQYNLTHSHYKEKQILIAEDKNNLKMVKGDPEEHSKSFQIYHDVIFKNTVDFFIEHIESIKKTSQDKNLKSPLDLNQEEKDYQWLLATTNILKNSIEKNKNNDEFLLQYHLHIELKEKCFLKMQCFNLFFEFYRYNERSNTFQIIVLDNKNNQHEPANQYNLNFFEQIPRVVDILSELLSFLRNNSSLQVRS